jgi:hypothetical protein
MMMNLTLYVKGDGDRPEAKALYPSLSSSRACCVPIALPLTR